MAQEDGSHYQVKESSGFAVSSDTEHKLGDITIKFVAPSGWHKKIVPSKLVFVHLDSVIDPPSSLVFTVMPSKQVSLQHDDNFLKVLSAEVRKNYAGKIENEELVTLAGSKALRIVTVSNPRNLLSLDFHEAKANFNKSDYVTLNKLIKSQDMYLIKADKVILISFSAKFEIFDIELSDVNESLKTLEIIL